MHDTQKALKVYLVGRPHFNIEEFIAFLEGRSTSWRRTSGATQAEEIVEAAGRVCYMSFGEKQSPRITGEYVNHLIEQGHESVLEHVAWSFVLAGISRSLTHQLVRHRVGIAFSQLSQQYHEESYPNFIVPPAIQSDPSAADAWERLVDASKRAYQQIVESLERMDSHVAPIDKRERRREILSAARSVLPNATETIVFMSANARALRHLLAVRGGIIGDVEMRALAAAILTRVMPEAPSLFSDFRIESLSDGSPIVRKITT